MTIKNTNITIHVKDLDRSIAFYTSIGMVETQRWANYYAQLTAPGVIIGLHPSSKLSGNSGNVSIGFATDNIAETQEALQKSGIQIEDNKVLHFVSTLLLAEEGGRFLHFNDPDGTALYFIESKW